MADARVTTETHQVEWAYLYAVVEAPYRLQEEIVERLDDGGGIGLYPFDETEAALFEDQDFQQRLSTAERAPLGVGYAWAAKKGGSLAARGDYLKNALLATTGQ